MLGFNPKLMVKTADAWIEFPDQVESDSDCVNLIPYEDGFVVEGVCVGSGGLPRMSRRFACPYPAHNEEETRTYVCPLPAGLTHTQVLVRICAHLSK